jgi:SAM-dependent methyltransferase
MLKCAKALVNRIRTAWFDSGDYWDRRYRQGGTSGGGSVGRLAKFKAGVINRFVRDHDVRSVIELGSGDGSQLELAKYPAYVGVDVSKAAVEATRKRFRHDPTKQFHSELPAGTSADLSLSLDVIYHLVEDRVFEQYMTTLFDAARRFVIVYSSNKDERGALHVRHRKFTDWIEQNRPRARLVEKIPNCYPEDPADPVETSFADFYIFAVD